MSRDHSRWTDRFSEYLEGGLDGAEQRDVEDHLAACGACRVLLEELRDVVARAGTLEDREPPRDLWPGIAAVIEAPGAARRAQVIELPAGRNRAAARTTRTIALTAPQMAAAAVLLIVLSVATTWWVGPGVAARDDGSRVAAEPSGAASLARVAVPPPNLADELADLEQVLESARAGLDPNTVRVLERNLAVIEQAIADSQRALALDPDNEFLAHHLERVFERKLTYLRDAARVLQWAS